MAVTSRQFRMLFDWPLALSAFGLMLFGLLALSSATGALAASRVQGLGYQQVFWILLATTSAAVAIWLPPRFWYAVSYLVYLAGVALLVLTLIMGTHKMGAERWLALGPIRLQPSEMGKVALILALARFLSNRKVSVTKLWGLGRAMVLVAIPALLIEQQPDLGTAGVYFAISIPMLYWAGLSNLYMFLIISPLINAVCAFAGMVPWLAFIFLFVGLLILTRPAIPWMGALIAVNLMVAVAAPQIYNGMDEYQQKRIETFFSPEKDPLGAGYQIIQSKVAIGSGGLWGKGFQEGSQTQLSYLPETHTDFIFAVLGEEWGFVGALGVLTLFIILLWRIFRIATSVNNLFGSFVCVGVGTMIAFHAFVNIGMTIGLMPVTGVPLTLVSYGGSALITNVSALGLVLGFGLRRHD